MPQTLETMRAILKRDYKKGKSSELAKLRMKKKKRHGKM